MINKDLMKIILEHLDIVQFLKYLLFEYEKEKYLTSFYILKNNKESNNF